MMRGMKEHSHTEWSRYYYLGEGYGVEALHAQFVSHRYPRHAHAYFVVGLIDCGVQSFWCRGSRHITPAGCVGIVNPGEPHTGEAASAEGYVYRTLYLQSAFLTRVVEEIGARPRIPFLKGSVLRDPILANLLSRFHHSLAERAPKANQEAFLYEAAARLVTRHADTLVVPKLVGKERPAVSKAREYMEGHFGEDISLGKLASLAMLSPFYFARAFEAETGLPPHNYLEGVRIRRARMCLDEGETIASTALSVGYSDQSHLTRRFKSFLGFTPGQYVREKNLQKG